MVSIVFPSPTLAKKWDSPYIEISLMFSVTPPVVLWAANYLPDFQKFKLHFDKI